MDVNFTALKSFSVAFTPRCFKLSLQRLHINGALIPYTDSIRIFFYRQSQERQYYVKTNENVICIACSNILVHYLVLVVEMYLLNKEEISVEHVTVIIWGYIIKSHRFLKFPLYTSICTVIFCLGIISRHYQDLMFRK